jgi:cytochrome c2
MMWFGESVTCDKFDTDTSKRDGPDLQEIKGRLDEQVSKNPEDSQVPVSP